MGLSTAVAGQRITANLLNRIYGEADTSSHTVTQAAFTQLSSSFNIAANDMTLNTAYRLTAWGIGTWGSTQQQLNVGLYVAGTQLTTVSIASTAFSTSANFRWKAQGIVICSATGSSGTLFKNLDFDISETANPVNPGTASTNAIATIGGSGTSAVDTTAVNSYMFEAQWGATTGAPTITCQATLYERVN